MEATNKGTTAEEPSSQSSTASQRRGSSTSEARRASMQGKQTVLEMHGYKTGNTLGYGSYATVKEAYSQKHKLKVAIKVITKKRAPDDYLEKFLPREMTIIRKLKHPALILNIQCIETNNRVYIVMEHAINGDLLNCVRTRKFIEEKQAALWFSQMADGLAYCHALGIVHRDLKCENVLLDVKFNLKICDFGFARDEMIDSNGRAVLSETYCGSYAYAAPEILTGTPYAAQLADVWSCGVILYVMVFGQLPFEDGDHRELLRQVRRGPEFTERSDRQVVSVLCRNLIKRILVKRELRVKITVIQTDPWLRKYVPSLAAKRKSSTCKDSKEQEESKNKPASNDKNSTKETPPASKDMSKDTKVKGASESVTSDGSDGYVTADCESRLRQEA